MKFKKTISLISTVAIVLISVCTPDNKDQISAESTQPIKILPIGDSITDGYGTDGSYRKFLYHELTDSGYSIDMVGPNWSWGDAEYSDPVSGENFTYDAAHCGYSGYSIMDYNGRNGILETIKKGNYLSQYSPDIVILQIGTNDIIDNHEIDSAGQRLDTLVTYIAENISSDAALFVTTIPDLEPNRQDVYPWFANYRHSADWTKDYSDAEVADMVDKQITSYNGQVKALIKSKQDKWADNIYFGDINSVITDVSAQLKDGVHPNNTGYKLMGEYWADCLKKYMSDNTVDPPELISGDINCDGSVTAADLVLLRNYLIGTLEFDTEQIKSADISSDGEVNVIDFILQKQSVII